MDICNALSIICCLGEQRKQKALQMVWVLIIFKCLLSRFLIVSRSVRSEEGTGSRAAEVQQFVQGITAELCCQHVYQC
jgi:hypothetical protein